MGIYIVLLIILFLSSKIKKQKQPLIVSFVLLLVIGAFRDYSVGTDTQMYQDYFKYYAEDWTEDSIEISYTALQHIFSMLGLEFSSLLFFMMFVTLLLTYHIVSKATINPMHGVLCYFLLYYYFNSFNIMRQALAVPIILLAYYYLDRKDYKHYFIYSVFGILCHYTSILSLLVFFVRDRIKPNQQMWMLSISLVVGCLPVITNMLITKLIAFAPVEYEKLYYYMDGDFIRQSTFSISRVFLTLYSIWLIRELKPNTLYLHIFVIGVVLQNFLAFNPSLARLAGWFTPIQILLIPNLGMYIKHKNHLKQLNTFSLVYMILVWIVLILANSGDVVPYEFRQL